MVDYEIKDDWYREGFNSLYPIVYGHRTVEAARPEAAFAAKHLRLTAQHRLLDVGCGNGRHMIHLQGHTPSVVGLDYSPDLLALARQTLGQDARLVRADMRAIPFWSCFDAVVNFFTSFGYFTSMEDNRRVVRQIAQALKPSGRFLVDYFNAPFVKAALVGESVRMANGYTIREHRWIDRQTRRVNKTTEVLKDEILVGRWSESVRLYEEAQFRALLASGGLTVEHIFGDFTGAPLSDIQPRMIAVGRKG